MSHLDDPDRQDSPPSALTVAGKGDIRHLRAQPDTALTPPAMRGFDPEFTDIVDYILRITHRIWEEKAIGLIYDYYLHNAVVHTSSGDIYGREAIIAGTVQALAAFPDRRLYGDEVIWKHSPGDVYYSSHRITHEGRNSGYTVYGAPTHRPVRYRAIADCIVRENMIVEEWLVRDELLLLMQLGYDPRELAKRFAERDARRGVPGVPPGEIERTEGQHPPRRLPPPPQTFDIDDFIRRMWHEVWNWRLLNRVDACFSETLTCEGASGRMIYGRGAYKAYILSLLSPFPDLLLTVDHVCAVQADDGTWRAASRWTMQGTHTGPGVYGEPTGRRIRVMGMTHHTVRDGQITAESTVFDEFALFKQLYAPG
jgi:predicted ester cyclase